MWRGSRRAAWVVETGGGEALRGIVRSEDGVATLPAIKFSSRGHFDRDGAYFKRLLHSDLDRGGFLPMVRMKIARRHFARLSTAATQHYGSGLVARALDDMAE